MPNNPLYVEPPVQPAPLKPNALVSYNLLRARRSRGWTQSDLGEVLGRHTGRAWSNASVSAAERAWQGGRPRKFDTDEIVAFCRIFDVPFAYFLLPPDESDAEEVSTAEEEKHGSLLRFPLVEYLRCILCVDPPVDFYARAARAVRDATGLDFQPAEWEMNPERDAELVRRSEGIKAQILEAPTEEVRAQMARAEEAAGRFDRWVKDMNVPNDVVMDMTQAKAEQFSLQVAAYLEQKGYLTEPQARREMDELRQRVNILSELLSQTISQTQAPAAEPSGSVPGVDRSFTEEESRDQPGPQDD